MGLTTILVVAAVLILFLLIPVVVHWMKEHGAPGPNASGSGDRTVRAPAGSPRNLSEEDRREMLDNVRNLARDNPAEAATILRKWIGDDHKP